MQVGPEKLSVDVAYSSPSYFVEGETDEGDIAGTVKTLEMNSFTLYGGEDTEHIEYTPEEDRCNSVMMNMEDQALERVQNKEIDVHSMALQ